MEQKRLEAGDTIKCKSIKDIARKENHLIKEGYEFRVSFKNLTVQITAVPRKEEEDEDLKR